MKKLILALSLVLTSFVFAEEVPLPEKVVMYDNPTLNGLPFAAVFSHDYHSNATYGGVDIVKMTSNSAVLVCAFLGLGRPYTYKLAKVQTKVASVLYVDYSLIANPVETRWADERGDFATTVFSTIGCFRKL